VSFGTRNPLCKDKGFFLGSMCLVFAFKKEKNKKIPKLDKLKDS